MPAAYCSVPISRFAQHAPLDQVWWLLPPAVGIGKTRAHPVSRIFSRIALAADRRLEARPGPGRDADDPFRAAHREGAGPGYGHCLHGHLRLRIVRGGNEHAISVVCARGIAVATLLPGGPHSVALG